MKIPFELLLPFTLGLFPTLFDRLVGRRVTPSLESIQNLASRAIN